MDNAFLNVRNGKVMNPVVPLSALILVKGLLGMGNAFLNVRNGVMMKPVVPLNALILVSELLEEVNVFQNVKDGVMIPVVVLLPPLLQQQQRLLLPLEEQPREQQPSEQLPHLQDVQTLARGLLVVANAFLNVKDILMIDPVVSLKEHHLQHVHLSARWRPAKVNAPGAVNSTVEIQIAVESALPSVSELQKKESACLNVKNIEVKLYHPLLIISCF